MRDIIQDIVRQSKGLMDVIKVTGTETETKIQGVDADKTLFLAATLKQPIPEFVGEFGVSNLGLLSGLLSFASYKTDAATFTVRRRKRDEKEFVEQFEFRDASGKGADFRLMAPNLVPEQATIAKIPWDVTFQPDKSKIAEFRELAKLYAEVDSLFGTKTEGKDLVAQFGDASSSTHRASMVLKADVGGQTINADLLWNTTYFLEVLKLGETLSPTVSLTTKGVMGITMETAFGSYTYYLRSAKR